MKKFMVLLLVTLVICSLVSVISGRTPVEPPHEHTYASEWSYNDNAHWHASTCGHDVKSGNASHSFGDDGYCVCGYLDPNYVPPVPSYYYLPSCITDYSDREDKVTATVTYTYDADLLGYTKTRVIDLDSKSKDVTTVRFAKDYQKYTVISEQYDYYGDKFVLLQKDKYEYELFDNGSYKYMCYQFDIESGEFVFFKEFARNYNELGQLVLETDKRANPDKEGAFYYYAYTTYKYDEDGYQLEYCDYDYDDTADRNLYLISCTEYTYNGDRTHAIAQDYYKYDEELVKDGWTDITIVVEDGVRKLAMQNYFQDGTEGNYNEVYYNADLTTIYTYYGGMNEKSGITLNEYGNITDYFFKDDTFDFALEVTYDDNQFIAKTVLEEVYSDFSSTRETTYTYNETNQITKAVMNISGESSDGTPLEEYQDELNVTYSTLQNDALLEMMDYVDDILSSYSHYILESDESIY